MSTQPARSMNPGDEQQYSFDEVPAWKAELNAKLEAHRRRRGPESDLPAPDAVGNHEGPSSARTPASQVAARVAERYANAPSYREVLAANAAAAAAAVAASAAAAEAHVAVHHSTQALLADFAGREQGVLLYDAPEAREMAEAGLPRHSAAGSPAGEPTIRYAHPLPTRSAVPDRALSAGHATSGIVDAFAEAEVPPATGLPARLIEFPRELVAPRKARPRLAEGPLFEDSSGSLRIFEVHGEGRQDEQAADTAALESESYTATEVAAHPDQRADRRPEHPAYSEASEALAWQSIRLGEHPVAPATGELQELTLSHRGRKTQPQTPPMPKLHVASLNDRGMAAVVDLAVVSAAFLLFVLVFTACTVHPPVDRAALVLSGVVFAAIGIFYQWLLLTWGGATLGMRYAQIALCSFEDENPARRRRTARVWASLAALLPVGLGLLWAVFDEDSLGWHDRMTRTYQRSYR